MQQSLREIMADVSNQSFDSLFKALRQRHPSLVAIEEHVIKAIDDEYNDLRRSANTRRYMLVISVILFFFATYPILFERGFSFAISWQSQLLTLIDQSELPSRNSALFISAFLLLISVPTYTMVIPSKLYRRLNPRMARRFDLNKGKLSFIVYAFMLNYLIALPIIVYSFKKELISKNIVDVATVVWLMIPIAFLAFTPIILLFFVLALRVTPLWQEPNVANPTSIIIHLARLLNLLDRTTEFPRGDRQLKGRIVKVIFIISDLMRRMYRQDALGDGVSLWSLDQMDCAANNFRSLATWVYFPQADTLNNLRARLCLYINILSLGTYHGLPREDVSHFESVVRSRQRKHIIRRFMMFVSLAIYMGFPVIVVAVLTLLFRVEIPSTIQSPLTILYIIWAVLGLISFLESVTPDVKDIVFDTIKSLIGRK